MDFRTPVALPDQSPALTPRSRVVLSGSCFAEHIGRHLAECLPEAQVAVNPSGVLYNPGSIYQSLAVLRDDWDVASQPPLFRGADGLWRSWLHAGLFASPDRAQLLARLAEAHGRARRVYEQADCLMVTFSTDRAYLLADGPARGTLVANCHKQPAALFEERGLDMAAQREVWTAWLRQLHKERPGVRVVFTLSPYRYAKYGFHASAVGKARLLLLIENLCHDAPNALYFPAYEIVTDELRDYRFYAPDMLHPSDQAVAYVWERFTQWSFTTEMGDYARERQALLRAMRHRPLHPESADYARFQARVAEERRRFEARWGTTL